jgi:circadian clock protein KaiB
LETYSFILYVAGNLPNSVQAVWNLKAMCSEYFPENHHLEIVDVFTDPQRGMSDGVVAIPTLVKLGPTPKQTIVGSLTDISLVLRSIGWTRPLNGQTEEPIE